MLPRPFAVIGFTVFFTLSILNQADTGATVAAIAAFSAALVVTLLLKQIRKAKVLPVACVSGLLACALLICSNSFIYHPATEYAGKACDLTARITNDAQLNYGNYYYEAEVITIDGQDVDLKIRLTFSSHPEVQAFDVISGRFNMYLPGTTNEDLLFANKAKGMYLAAYPSESGFEIIERNVSGFIEKAVYDIRNGIKNSVYNLLPNEYGGLAAALILGDKSGISRETLSDFNEIGITHLICVSGLHLSLWSLFIFAVFKRTGLNEKFSAVISALFVILFMFVAGMTYSVVRAGIMMLIYLFSVVLDRQRDSLNSLGFAVTVIAIENPFSIGALGLQLSVLSTAGLIMYFQFLQPLIFEKIDKININWLLKILKTSLSSLAVTAAAVSFTLPITLNLYKSFNFAVFIANFLTVTAAGICMVLCGLGALLNILFQGIPNPMAFIGGLLCKYITWISGVIAEFDFLTFRIENDKAVLIITGIFLVCSLAVLFAYYGKAKPLTALFVCSTLFLNGLFIFSFSEKYETKINVVDCGNSTSVLLINNNKNYLFGCGGTVFSAENSIADAIDFAGGADYIFTSFENEKNSSLLIPILKNNKPDSVFSDDLSAETKLLLNNVPIYSVEDKIVQDNTIIRYYSVDGSEGYFVKTDDLKVLICFDYVKEIDNLPDDCNDFDVLICRGDYPKDVFSYSPEVVIINAENSRGVRIQNELLAQGINSVATAECGNIIIRADNGNISYYRE